MADPSPRAEAEGLIEFIDASPSPYHACAAASAMLRRAGFTPLAKTDSWPLPHSEL